MPSSHQLMSRAIKKFDIAKTFVYQSRVFSCPPFCSDSLLNGLRALVPEDEDVEDRQVEGETQHELHHHHPGEDLVRERVRGFAVVNGGVGRHVCLAGHSTASSTQSEVTHSSPPNPRGFSS